MGQTDELDQGSLPEEGQLQRADEVGQAYWAGEAWAEESGEVGQLGPCWLGRWSRVIWSNKWGRLGQAGRWSRSVSPGRLLTSQTGRGRIRPEMINWWAEVMTPTRLGTGWLWGVSSSRIRSYEPLKLCPHFIKGKTSKWRARTLTLSLSARLSWLIWNRLMWHIRFCQPNRCGRNISCSANHCWWSISGGNCIINWASNYAWQGCRHNTSQGKARRGGGELSLPLHLLLLINSYLLMLSYNLFPSHSSDQSRLSSQQSSAVQDSRRQLVQSVRESLSLVGGKQLQSLPAFPGHWREVEAIITTTMEKEITANSWK